MITRRSLFCAIAAPAIVRACNLMPVRALTPTPHKWSPSPFRDVHPFHGRCYLETELSMENIHKFCLGHWDGATLEFYERA